MINDITTIRYSAPSVYAIYDDLDLLENRFMKFRKQILSKAKRVDLKRDIELDNISYKYPGSDEFAVKDISITIPKGAAVRSEEHTSELQSRGHLVCRLLLE